MKKTIIKYEEDNQYMTLEELKVLNNLMRRLSATYQGIEVKARLNQNEREKMSDVQFSISQLVTEIEEDGYELRELIK